MTTIKNCLSVEIKRFYRSVFSWIASALLILYASYGFYFNIIRFNKIPEALNSSGYFLSFLILLFMIIGVFVSNNENSNYCSDIIYSTSKGLVYKYLSKLILIILYSVVYTAIIILLLFLFYLIGQVPIKWYSISLKYILLYFLITSIISGLLGLISGTLILSRGVFVVIVILWLMVSPLSSGIYKYLMIFLSKDLSYYANIVNLAQQDPTVPMNVLYGLPMERIRLVVKMIYLLAFLLIYLLLIYIKSTKITVKIVLTSFLILMILVIPIYFFSTNENYKVFYKELSSMDNRVLSEVKYYDLENSYNELLDNEINLETINNSTMINVEEYGIDVKSEISYVAIESIKNHTFVLHHNFKVNSIMLNGEKIEFEQRGDQINVIFPYLLEKNEHIVLLFEYAGIGSPIFFASNQAIQLLGGFPWMPTVGYMPTETWNGGNDSLISLPENEIYYIIQYEGPEPVYINLTKKHINVYEGKSSNGVYIIGAEDYSSDEMDDYLIYYPIALFNHIDGIMLFLKQVIPEILKVNKDLTGEPVSIDKNIIITSFYPNHNVTGSSVYLFDNTIVVNVESIHLVPYISSIEPFSYNITSNAINVYTSRIKSTKMSRYMVDVFSLCLCDWYQQKATSSFNRNGIIKSIINDTETGIKNDDDRKSLERCIDYLDALSKNEEYDSMQIVFQKWYTEMNKDLEFTYIKLEEVLQINTTP